MKSSENEKTLNEYRQNIPALKEIIEERKEKAVETLSASYARNRLPLEEYERLVEYINKIESERELVVIEKIVAEYDLKESSSNAAQSVYDDDETDYPQHSSNSLKENMTFLSNRTFQGPVKSGSQFVSILSTERIIIKKADLRSGQTVLNVTSILGESVIFVEHGIRVINRAIPIIGSCETKLKDYKNTVSDKELIISGTAILGDIIIKPFNEQNLNKFSFFKDLF